MSSTLLACSPGGDAQGLCRRAEDLFFGDDIETMSDDELQDAISAEELGDPPDGAVSRAADSMRSAFDREDFEGFDRSVSLLLDLCAGVTE